MNHYYIVSKFDDKHGGDTHITPSGKKLGIRSEAGDVLSGSLDRAGSVAEAHQYDEYAKAFMDAEAMNGKLIMVFRSDGFQRVLVNFEHP